MKSTPLIADDANAEMETIRMRLAEAEETLRAIRSGEVDAVVVAGAQGDQLYTLTSADEPYRVLIEEMNEGAVTLSTDGDILYCNRHFAELVRAPQVRVFGSPVAGHVLPADRNTLARLLQAAQSGPAIGELTLLAADGVLVPVRLALNRLPANSMARVCLVVTDMAEQKKKETALLNMMADLDSAYAELKRETRNRRQSEEAFRTLAESAPQLVWMCEPDGMNVYFNQRWVEYTGLTLEQSCGRGWSTPFHPDDQQRAWNAWNHSTSTGDAYEIECRLRRADAEYHWFLIRGVPLRDDRGSIVRWVGTCTDIDGLKRAEAKIRQLNAGLEIRVAERTAELEAANQELEAFAYSVSHDLRSPLRSIDGFSRILLRDCAPTLDCKARANLERVRLASQRMGDLIDDLLALSRASRADLRRSPLDLAVLARAIAEELQQTAPERKVVWKIAPSAPVTGDPILLRSALENLLGNAWKFSSRCAETLIEFGLIERGHENVFFVRDNGAGFDMAYAGKLFGPFQRLHAANEFPGTGIGLATVQRIVRRHGGRVWAEAVVGAGAVIFFTLSPLLSDHAKPDHPPGGG